MGLIQFVANFLSGAAHHPCRNTYGGCFGRNVAQHHRTGGDLGAVTDREVAQQLGAGPYHHAIAQSGMAFAGFLAGTAQGCALIESAVIADDGGFADDHAGAVVDEESLTDLRTGMDLNAGQKPSALAHKTGGEIMPAAMERVGQPIEHQRVEAGVEEQYLRAGACGGISLADGVDVPSDLPGEIYSGSAQAADLFRRIF